MSRVDLHSKNIAGDHRKQGIRVLQFLLCALSGTVSKMMQFLPPFSSTWRRAALLFMRQQQLGADQRVTSCSLNQQMQPSCTSWCARTMRLISFSRLKWSTTLCPKIQPAPREFLRHASMFSGSDHMRSASGPSWGISCLRSSRRIWSMVGRSGERPPWTQRMLPLTTAPRGRKSKVSQKYFQQLELPYFLLISSRKPYIMVMLRLSWLPRSRQMRSGYLTFRQNSSVMVSTELYPRSTKSPIMMNLLSGSPPPFANRFFTSKNCPWMSPAMFTGDSTLTMFDSSARTPFTRLHSARTADSVIGLHSRADSYQASTFINQIKYGRAQKGSINSGCEGRGMEPRPGTRVGSLASMITRQVLKRSLSLSMTKVRQRVDIKEGGFCGAAVMGLEGNTGRPQRKDYSN